MYHKSKFATCNRTMWVLIVAVFYGKKAFMIFTYVDAIRISNLSISYKTLCLCWYYNVWIFTDLSANTNRVLVLRTSIIFHHLYLLWYNEYLRTVDATIMNYLSYQDALMPRISFVQVFIHVLRVSVIFSHWYEHVPCVTATSISHTTIIFQTACHFVSSSSLQFSHGGHNTK